MLRTLAKPRDQDMAKAMQARLIEQEHKVPITKKAITKVK